VEGCAGTTSVEMMTKGYSPVVWRREA